jgi:hypothetical protein
MAGRRRILAVMAMASLCALLASCGGSSGQATHAAGTTGAGTTPASTASNHVAASGSQLEAIIQDDDELLYTPPKRQYQVLRQMKALGVDVVKVALIWRLIAPAPDSTSPPSFTATDPAAYPVRAWNRYDLLVEEAHYLGLKVYFQIDPPAPPWGLSTHFPRGQGKLLGQVPDFRLFNQFVQAVGRRYSGSDHDIHGRTIPRVSMWGIWNEPNWRNWLNPISLDVGGIKQTSQPMLYRGVVNAAWRGLQHSGHEQDTVLIGETANIGSVTPIKFIEDLYCVGPDYRALTGTAATAAGCPTSGNRSAFVAQNPGLFHMTGYAHHPYAFGIAPDQPSSVATELALYNIPELERMLTGVFAGYGVQRPGGVPIYVSEWGYVTNPPNPQYHTTLAQQATYLNEGEYEMWREPSVKALAQFLLIDVPAPPTSSPTAGDWLRTFTTGLIFHDGKPKPALAAYRIPIWVPAPHPGSRVTIWGQLRPADHTHTQTGLIDFQPQGSASWRRLGSVKTTSAEGFLLTHVAVPSAGLLRLAWQSPSGPMFYSRSVPVS